MDSDIKTPGPSQGAPDNKPDRLMNSLRLRGHKAEEAKQRLVPEPPPESAMFNPQVNTDNTDPKQLASEIENIIAEKDATPPKPPSQLKLTWQKHKRLIVIAVAVFVALIIGLVVFLLTKSSPQATPQNKTTAKAAPPAPPAAPIEVPSPLTGVIVKPPELAKRPVTGIMIENSPDARPQSGLRDAGIVFEAIAEGGITRFLALYQEGQPNYIGPVRSIRPYYLDWLSPFDASIAHVGGSLDALQQVRSGMKDLDQFFNASTFTRITQRFAPHNVYTSFARLDSLNASKNYTVSNFTSFARKKADPLTVPSAKSIDLAISGYLYNVHYDYDAKTNSYLRSEGGKPHIDITSANDKVGQQLHPDVVMALVMPYSYSAADDGYRSTYGTTGSGDMYVFQDGGVTKGTWTKADRHSQFVFKDTTGAEVKLNAGQTWITVVSSTGLISYKP